MSTGESQPRRQFVHSPFVRPEVVVVPAPVYEVKDRVTHDRYGLGTVVGLERGAVIVNFGAETRRINLPSPKLSPL